MHNTCMVQKAVSVRAAHQFFADDACCAAFHGEAALRQRPCYTAQLSAIHPACALYSPQITPQRWRVAPPEYLGCAHSAAAGRLARTAARSHRAACTVGLCPCRADHMRSALPCPSKAALPMGSQGSLTHTRHPGDTLGQHFGMKELIAAVCCSAGSCQASRRRRQAPLCG